MCSSRYCSNFAPLFSLFFGLSLFFRNLWFFYFFDIFSSLRSTQEVTTENLSLNKWKTWPVKNSEDGSKIEKKLVTQKRGSCDQFLAKIKFFDWFWYMERRNPSSYAKTGPISSLDSELEDKTGTMRKKVVTKARIWWNRWGKTHELDSNTN
jgi:hypothetical protein